MTMTHHHNGLKISLQKRGANQYTKISYPLRFGMYCEIEDKDNVFQFNLNGEIVFARGKGEGWLHPQEWLKRTIGNDWIYYSTGGYTGVYEAIGEYYLPNLQYPTNSLLGGKPFETPAVKEIVNRWYSHIADKLGTGLQGPTVYRKFVERVLDNTPEKLEEKANRLFATSGGRVTVLPPDSRHVDYNIIPLAISSGCLYKCPFCKVKTAKPFKEMGKDQIDVQLQHLVEIYGEDLRNYNSVFLGEHDALCCSTDTIVYGVKKAYEALGFAASYMHGANFFMFGSVDSLLEAPEHLFQELSTLPGLFYINIGLESTDQQALDMLGKPLTTAMVEEAFFRIQQLNDTFLNVEITANFLMDESLGEQHYTGFLKLTRDSLIRPKPKGCVYLSPLAFGTPSRELVLAFNRLKLLSRVPTFLYIIQRL